MQIALPCAGDNFFSSFFCQHRYNYKFLSLKIKRAHEETVFIYVIYILSVLLNIICKLLCVCIHVCVFQRDNEENVSTLELSVQEFSTQDLSSVTTFVFYASCYGLAICLMNLTDLQQ